MHPGNRLPGQYYPLSWSINMKNFFLRIIPTVFFIFFFAAVWNTVPAEAAETLFRVGSAYWVTSGSTIAVDVNIENPHQVFGCTFELGYDENIVRAADVSKGELLITDNNNTLYKDLSEAEDGQITVSWINENSEPLSSGGVLFRIFFTVQDEGSTTLSVSDLDLFEKYSSGSDPDIIDGTISTSSAGDTSLRIITNSYLPEATLGSWYSTSLSASGGSLSYTWSETGGTLPRGLTLSSSGIISGIPTSTGNYSATIRVTDGDGASRSRSFSLTVYEIGEHALNITSSTTLTRGRKGFSYSFTLSASGGQTPYRWSKISGSLPPGLYLSSSTGVLSGTPTSTGSYAFTLRVTDDNNARQEQQCYLIITDTGYISSEENLFRNLNITRSTMTLNLSPADMPYTMVVTNDTNWINLTVILDNTADRLRINETAHYSEVVRTVPLSTGANLVTIGISSADSNYRNYILTIYRLP